MNENLNYKITKFPNSYNQNKILREKIKQKYMVCPFCGETREYNLLEHIKNREKSNGIECYPFCTTRYGKQKPWYDHMFEESRYWKTLLFTCHTCGAEWESEEF